MLEERASPPRKKGGSQSAGKEFGQELGMSYLPDLAHSVWKVPGLSIL